MELSTIYKAEKGIIKISAQVEDNTISGIRITGDFFMVPEESIVTLEKMLAGEKLESEAISKAIDGFYATGVITPSMEKGDLVKAVMGLKAV